MTPSSLGSPTSLTLAPSVSQDDRWAEPVPFGAPITVKAATAGSTPRDWAEHIAVSRSAKPTCSLIQNVQDRTNETPGQDFVLIKWTVLTKWSQDQIGVYFDKVPAHECMDFANFFHEGGAVAVSVRHMRDNEILEQWDYAAC